MVGFYKKRDEQYYVCNSIPNRRGLGCGQGVYVKQHGMEKDVISGLEDVLEAFADEKGLVKKVNTELKRIWEKSHGCDPNAAKRLQEIDAKVTNIRQSIEDGLADTVWANSRIRELSDEREKVSAAAAVRQRMPQINAQAAAAFRRELAEVVSAGTNAQKKRMLGEWVREIKLAPDDLEVEISYKIPEPVVDSLGAGRGFEPLTFGL